MSALAAVTVPAAPAFGYEGTFVDDDESVHEPNIEAVAAAGIARGCNPPDNDRFCPRDTVTRGQMAAFLTRALSLDSGQGADLFVDDDTSVFEGDIDRLATAEITFGCNPPVNTMFCPDGEVTRGQMAAFLVRAFDYPAVEESGFTDVESSVFTADIAALAQQGVTKGCDPPANTRFCPDDPVTREQMATFLARALGLEPIEPAPVDPAWFDTPTPQGLQRVIPVPPGGSPTLAEAIAAAAPGDVIELGAGTHLNTGGNIVLSNQGTPTAWIAIRGEEGSRPVIDLEGGGEFRIAASNVLLENVEIVDGSGNNLHIAPEATSIENIVVRNVLIHDLRDGPGAAVKINRNNPQAAGVARVYIEDSDLSESLANAVVDGVGVSYAVLRDSWIHDNEPGSHGVFYKGGSDHVLIERNLISGIRQNAALQLGGNTGFGFFNPAWPDWEGVDQFARNNVIADFTDSAVEIRGVNGGSVYHNTIVTQTGFAIFRLSCGNTDSAGVSGNLDIDVVNNLVIGTGGDPQYARNDCDAEDIVFGAQGWFGVFHDSGSSTPLIPSFPQPADTWSTSTAGVVHDPSWSGLSGLSDALDRYALSVSSLAIARGEPLASEVPLDIESVVRSSTAPSLGAFEQPR
jgi:hypothetical protein